MSAIADMLLDGVDLLFGSLSPRGKRNRRPGNADLIMRCVLIAVLLTVVVTIYAFWAAIVSFIFIAFWVAVAVGALIGVARFFMD